jgi:hypothetical protein
MKIPAKTERRKLPLICFQKERHLPVKNSLISFQVDRFDRVDQLLVYSGYKGDCSAGNSRNNIGRSHSGSF